MNGTILFSSISPDYELNLKEELFGCFKYIGIPFDVLNKMPTRDRKFYILRHNKVTEEDNNRIMRRDSGNQVDGESINTYANLEQQNMLNAKKRG